MESGGFTFPSKMKRKQQQLHLPWYSWTNDLHRSRTKVVQCRVTCTVQHCNLYGQLDSCDTALPYHTASFCIRFPG